MFGSALKWVPRLLLPLVELLVKGLRDKKRRRDAEQAARFGEAYVRAYLGGDQERMKQIHARAMIHAKYVAYGEARKELGE